MSGVDGHPLSHLPLFYSISRNPSSVPRNSRCKIMWMLSIQFCESNHVRRKGWKVYIKGGNYVRGVGLLVEILVSVLHGSFVCLILLTLKLYLKGIIFELHWRRPPTDILSLISRSQPQKLVSQEELVSVCNILAEALLGNDKATSRGLWKYRWFLCWWQGVLSSSRLMNLLFSHSRLC